MRKILQKKAEGNIMIYAFVLSAMIITLGLGIQKLLLTELRFSADLLQSERAHFAAESGVEQALLWLQQNEIEHLERYTPAEDLLDGVSQEITIVNAVNTFSFLLGPEESKQVILQRDTTKDAIIAHETDVVAVESFSVSAEPMGNDASQPNTFELNVCLGSSANEITSEQASGNAISRTNGTDGVEVCIVKVRNQNVFASLLDGPPDREKNQNRTMLFTFDGTPSGGMTAHRAEITSVGKDKSREKHITFKLERDKSLLGIGGIFVQ